VAQLLDSYVMMKSLELSTKAVILYQCAASWYQECRKYLLETVLKYLSIIGSNTFIE
jgi:hypothetical protein